MEAIQNKDETKDNFVKDESDETKDNLVKDEKKDDLIKDETKENLGKDETKENMLNILKEEYEKVTKNYEIEYRKFDEDQANFNGIKMKFGDSVRKYVTARDNYRNAMKEAGIHTDVNVKYRVYGKDSMESIENAISEFGKHMENWGMCVDSIQFENSVPVKVSKNDGKDLNLKNE